MKEVRLGMMLLWWWFCGLKFVMEAGMTGLQVEGGGQEGIGHLTHHQLNCSLLLLTKRMCRTDELL